MLLLAMALLCIKVPRAILPGAVLAIPALGERLTPWARGTSSRVLANLACLVVPGVAAMTNALSPWQNLGLSVHPSLDTSGVGAILDQFEEREGPLLSTFGWSSNLLRHPSAVRHGVVMDGRQEAYPATYYHGIYVPFFTLDGAWPGHVESTGISFYFEPFSTSRDRTLAPAFRRIGWELIGWDESGRLYAKPGVARRNGLSPLRWDPEDVEGLAAMSREELKTLDQMLHQRAHSASGTGRDWVALGRVRLVLGDIEGAWEAVEGGESSNAIAYAGYWEVREKFFLLRGDPEQASHAAQQARRIRGR